MPPTGVGAKIFLAALAALIFFVLVMRSGSWSTRIVGLVGSGALVAALLLQVRYHVGKAAVIRVDDRGVLLPAVPYRPAVGPIQHADVKFAYVIDAAGSPLLVVETRQSAYTYRATNFADRADLRRLALAVNARAGAASG